MPKCIECDNFTGKRCSTSRFVAKVPDIHLECAGYVFTEKWNCLKNYDDICKHRETSDDPFSADWCCRKNTYCDNNKLKVE